MLLLLKLALAEHAPEASGISITDGESFDLGARNNIIRWFAYALHIFPEQREWHSRGGHLSIRTVFTFVEIVQTFSPRRRKCVNEQVNAPQWLSGINCWS